MFGTGAKERAVSWVDIGGLQAILSRPTHSHFYTPTFDHATSAAEVRPALRINAGPSGHAPPLDEKMPRSRCLSTEQRAVAHIGSSPRARASTKRPPPYLPHARPFFWSSRVGVLSRTTASRRHAAVAAVTPSSLVAPRAAHMHCHFPTAHTSLAGLRTPALHLDCSAVTNQKTGV